MAPFPKEGPCLTCVDSGGWDMDVSLWGSLLRPLQEVIEFGKMLSRLPATERKLGPWPLGQWDPRLPWLVGDEALSSSFFGALF